MRYENHADEWREEDKRSKFGAKCAVCGNPIDIDPDDEICQPCFFEKVRDKDAD